MIVHKKSVVEIENIINDALAAKKEEMGSIQQLQQQLDAAAEENRKLTADNARLENNAVQSNKDRIALEREIAKSNEVLRNKELQITSDRNKDIKDISKEELQIKRDGLELEKEQVLFDTGRAQDVRQSSL
jgi:chromosome segregation ATPase